MRLVRIVAAASVAMGVMIAGSAAFAEEVDINAASTTGTTISLDAGTYDVSEIQGLYTSANLISGPNPIYRPTFNISIDGGAATTYPAPSSALGDYSTSSTAAAALALFETYQAANPISFTLGSASTVNFVVPDTYYPDNTGGISLSVVSAAPEPSVWMLTIAAIGGIGFMLRRSKKTVDSNLNDGIVA